MENELIELAVARRSRGRIFALCLAAVILLVAAPAPADDAAAAVATPIRMVDAEFMPDGRRMLVERQTGDIEIRAVPDGTLLERTKVPHGSYRIKFSPDGRVMAATRAYTGGPEIPLWDTETWKPLKPIRVEGKQHLGFAFSPAGDIAAIGVCDDKPVPDLTDNTVAIWDMKEQKLRKLLHGTAHAPPIVAFSPKGEFFGCAGFESPVVDVWSTDNFELARTIQGNSLAMRGLLFMPAGATSAEGRPLLPAPRLVTNGEDVAIRIFLCHTYEEFQTIRIHPPNGGGAVLPLPGDRILTSAGCAIRIWDILTGRELAILRFAGREVGPRLSPDGQTLLTNESTVKDDTIRFWSVPALLKARGEVKPDDCEKWPGRWQSAPPEGKRVRGKTGQNYFIPDTMKVPEGRER